MAVRPFLACLALLAAAPAAAQPAPSPVQAMVDDVFASGSDAEIAAVVKYARRTAPELAEALDRRVAARVAERSAAEQARLANPAPLANWAGRGEIGASLASGNTDTLGVYASLRATRQGVRWRHELRGEAAYQETNGVRSQERVLLAYEPRYKVNARLSAYGLLQAEHDPVLGYEARYSVSAGLGYRLIGSDKLSVDVQGGPAFRHAEPINGPDEDGFSGRGALDARWQIGPGLKLTQTGAAFFDSRGNTFSATTGLEAQLFGPVAARLSYNLQYESQPSAGRVATDTLGRITLVYGF